MTKFKLLTAASAAVMIFAGAAQAGTITAGVGTTPVAATAGAPFQVASERTDASMTTAAGGFRVSNALASDLVVTAGTTQNYRVTFTVTNGTIASSSLVVANNTVAVGAASVASAGTTANSATFIVTVTAAGVDVSIDEFALTTTLTSPSEQSVSVAALTELLAGGVATTVDNTSATTLITYAPILGAFTATSNNAVAALDNFQTFAAGVAPAAPITAGPPSAAEMATDFFYAINTGTFYANISDPAPAAISASALLNGGSLVITSTGGEQLNSLVPTLTAVGGGAPFAAATRTASTATIVLDAAESQNFVGTTTALRPDFILTQNGTPVTIAPATFSAAFTPTANTGYTLTAPGAVNAGALTLAGTTFIAPWFGGNEAQSGTTVRLTNSASVTSGEVTLALRNAVRRPAGQTTGQEAFSPAECSQLNGAAITVPTTADLLIGTAEAAACFGNFIRGDLYITVRSADDNLTAKMRNSNATGNFETSLGRFGAPTTY